MVDDDGRGFGRRGPAAGSGDDEGALAPVIPLFGGGGRSGRRPVGRDDETTPPTDSSSERGFSTGRGEASSTGAGATSSTGARGTATNATAGPGDGRPVEPGDELPVEPDDARDVGDDAGTGWHTTWVRPPAREDHPSARSGTSIRALPDPVDTDRHAASRARFQDAKAAAEDDAADPDEIRDRAEAVLLRKLRTRSLSLSESRTALRAIEGVDDALVEELVDRFVDLGYLDDGALADQLALSGVERKGQGRRAVVQTMLKRGIPRDVADAAVDALPDDDDDRALEFARGKARAMTGQDYDTALRRLAGQLSRRGYPSSVSFNAARTALADAGIGRARPGSRPATGVRFTPDDD